MKYVTIPVTLYKGKFEKIITVSESGQFDPDPFLTQGNLFFFTLLSVPLSVLSSEY